MKTETMKTETMKTETMKTATMKTETMKTATMKTATRFVLLLMVAAVVTAAAALADDSDKAEDKEKRDRREILIERLRHGDCPQLLAAGENGHLLRLGSFGYLGVSPTALTPELRAHFGVPDDVGVLIGRVEDDSPAAAAGLQVGDILTRLGEDDVTSGGSLRRLVRQHEKGDEVLIEYWRAGKIATATLAIGEHQRCGLDISSVVDLENLPHLDLEKNLKIEHLPRLEHLMELHEFDGEALERVRDRMRDAFESQDWEGHLERIRDVDLSEIEERLQEVMERLHTLEGHIDIEKKRIHSGEDLRN